ncbi:hypothetical protein WR25_26543 [Diploscapter pachys]|uniref:Core-2/I-Branching enzyme n=1 Tax=Diploscapter pachys TaxID=2018661 RepID=A0A2A2LIE6_9BILA|nr:hypothetical protein WR25_26543 [Diploscapter pachys]
MDKSRKWAFHYDWIEEEIFKSKNICQTIDKYFFFEKEPLSLEEAEFPLAYGLVVYRNIVQVFLELSIFYYPQNAYCVVVDANTNNLYKNAMMGINDCFPNIKVFVGNQSNWGTMGILDNVFTCFSYLARLDHPWKYYQYLSGVDLPLRTNLEMVRVMKALNGSINSDVDVFDTDRYRNMEGVVAPLPLYKSCMSVAIPRPAANYMLTSRKVHELMRYLSSTWVPDESFWATLAGSPALLPMPGSFRARDVIWMRRNMQLDPPEENTVDSIGTSYIMRYQVWEWQKACMGKITSWSCVYGVRDMYEEIRRRSYESTDFNAKSYSEIPIVEMFKGKPLTELTHPSWLMRSSFYLP